MLTMVATPPAFECETDKSPQSSVALQDLFRKQQLDTSTMSPSDWIVFFVYLPFGCVLLSLRFVLGLTLIQLAPRMWRQRLMPWLLGLVIRTPGKMELPMEGAFLLSNHCSYLDSWVLSASSSSKCEFATVVWSGVPTMIKSLARPVIEVFDSGRNRAFLRQVRAQLEDRNVIFFPEGTFTDTLTGLLTFEKGVFAMKRPIYLLALRYHRPLPYLQPKSMSQNPYWQSAIEMFQPWTNVEVIPLGEFVRLQNESPQAYADRAQRRLADALGLVATNWTRHDRNELLLGGPSRV
ncbi:MAG: 1-acyl-sn-glycerol-3-phosphate acyltransferase [Planctomycetota bacterium]